jgi:hypothetical protein
MSEISVMSLTDLMTLTSTLSVHDVFGDYETCDVLDFDVISAMPVMSIMLVMSMMALLIGMSARSMITVLF